MKVRRVDMNPRVRTVVFRSLLKISGLSGEATLRCCVRCWGPFGLAQLLGGSGGFIETALPFRSRGTRNPTVVPRFWPFECNLQSSGTLARRPFYTLHFTFYTLPARWRVGFRRAIASRKAVPADVKDQTSRPLRGKMEILCHIPPPNARGDFGKLKFCARGRRG